MSFFTDFGPLIGGAVQAVGSIVGGSRQARAVEKANTQSTALQQAELDRIRADLAPFRDVGVTAINKLSDMFVTGKTPIETDPGYQFRLSEGQKAQDRSAASRGLLLSGPQARANTEFNQNFATREANNVFNRLNTLAGGGQAATGTGAGAGQNIALNIGNSVENAAQRASEARRSGFTGVGNAVTDTINNYLTLDVLRRRGVI